MKKKPRHSQSVKPAEPIRPESTGLPEHPGPQEPEENIGLVCPRCECAHFLVIYTRPRLGYIMRLRECRHCGRRMITREHS